MEKKFSGDPSEIIQSFRNFNLQIHCCRYWWVTNWEHKELSFPFWRIYSNVQEGGFMEYRGQIYEMEPNKLYLIAPNTNYSSRLYNNHIPEEGYNFTGGRISDIDKELLNKLIKDGAVEHLFIHFTLGYPYDNVSPGIYIFNKDKHLDDKINILRDYLTRNVAQFNFTVSLTIQSLICDLLINMGEEKWKDPIRDVRIAGVINHIENNIDNDFTNESLANIANMATNAFSRLFKEHTGSTVQHFIRKKRVNKACLMLLHSNHSIDEVADRTGFANRYHFTRIFKKVRGHTPAKYRKDGFFQGILSGDQN